MNSLPIGIMDEYREALSPIIEEIKGNRSTPCVTCKEAFCCKGKSSLLLYGDEIEKISKLTTKKVRKRMGRQKGSDNYTCPFLENNKCTIYEDRPLACYMYYIKSDSPDICNTDGLIPIYNMLGTMVERGKDVDIQKVTMDFSCSEELKDVVLNSLHRF